MICFFLLPLRYGLKEGFSNEVKSRVHSAGAAFQKKTYQSMHENVPGYEQDWVPTNSSGIFNVLFIDKIVELSVFVEWRSFWTRT